MQSALIFLLLYGSGYVVPQILHRPEVSNTLRVLSTSDLVKEHRIKGSKP